MENMTKLKEGLETKGLMVNVRKTKIMRCGVGFDAV